jgi:hypothetical protein
MWERKKNEKKEKLADLHTDGRLLFFEGCSQTHFFPFFVKQTPKKTDKFFGANCTNAGTNTAGSN